MSKARTIVVTGASGLLGAQLVRRLAPEATVYAVVRKTPSEPVPGVRYIELDLGADWTHQSLPASVDAVVHLAQSASFREFPGKALDVFHVNVASTARLLDYAHRAGASQFAYASSGGIYGPGPAPFRETSPPAPADQLGYYLASKVCGEALCQSYAALIQVLVLRYFFIYGPGQNRTMLIPRLADQIRAGKPVTLQGGDGLRLNPIHVRDAGEATARALQTPASATYNIAGAESLSLRALCSHIGEVVGRAPVFDAQEGAPRHTVADVTAMRERLWVPQTPLSMGLKDVVA